MNISTKSDLMAINVESNQCEKLDVDSDCTLIFK